MKGWVARGSNGHICLFRHKPECVRGVWLTPPGLGGVMSLEKQEFPECTFKNSPLEVTISIKYV